VSVSLTYGRLKVAMPGKRGMKLETKVFDLYPGRYRNLTELAKAMGISDSQVYRVLQGKRYINQKFIIGAVKAFPEHKLDDLFYVAPDGSENEGTTNKAGTVAGSRRDEVVKFRNAGLSYAEIGRRLGMSRERARQIVKSSLQQKSDLRSKIMLTPSDVAQLFVVHLNTVRRWSRKGILKSYRIGLRGDRRFRQEDVDNFLKKGEIE
jgi:excisionase family DNA binding protein